MAVSYSYQKLPLPFPSIFNRFSTQFLFKAPIFSQSKSPFLFSLISTTTPLLRSSPSSIFLPFLDQEEEEPEPEPETEEEEDLKPLIEEEEEDNEDNDDPFVRFFKSRSETTQDPKREGKFSLQKNRRSSWRLAPTSEFADETGPGFVDDEPATPPTPSQPSEEESPEGIVGEILRIARDLPENLTIGEALEGFEGRVSKKECVDVLGVLGQEGLLMDCLYFFEWMGSNEPCLVSPRACSVLFPLLGKAGMGEKLVVLFENLPKKKEFGDVHVYNAAISGLMCSKRYDDAWKVYEMMESNNVRPDHVTCSITITLMRKLGRSAKEAWDFFEKMNRRGTKWSPEVLGALIKSFCDEGLKTEALVIQNEMARKGVYPNVIIYNTLMDAYCKSNQVEEAEAMYDEMKVKGIKPTSSTFNILMDAYSKRIQPEVVEKLLEEMLGLGLDPNVKSYTCLISAYAKKKMSEMASDAFLRMRKVGINPSSHSYTALIHAYSVTGWHEKAYTAFENMRAQRLKPSIETYTALLDAFRRAGDAETLMKIWKMMMRERVEGTRVTFNTLVDGFAKQGRYADARDVVFEFNRAGLKPTVMTYNMLVNAYARGGQHSKIPQLLKEMENHDLRPDSITYCTMIYAFVRVRDFRRAFFYHKQMVKNGQVPDAGTYEKLRAILDVKAARKNKKDRSAILGIINSKMGMVKAKKKGKKDEFWKNRKVRVRPLNSASVDLSRASSSSMVSE